MGRPLGARPWAGRAASLPRGLPQEGWLDGVCVNREGSKQELGGAGVGVCGCRGGGGALQLPWHGEISLAGAGRWQRGCRDAGKSAPC